MPFFTVPLREHNPCHSPADGQFSVKGSCNSGKQTDNPAFKEWFGDSVVTNKDGSPMVVYHSTSANPDSFRPYTHFGTAGAANDRASALRSFSTMVVGRKEDQSAVFPVYLSIQNPLRLPDLAEMDNPDLPFEDGSGFHPRSWESETDLAEVLYEMNEITRDEFWDVQYSPKKAFELLKAKGYDGIVYKNVIEDAGKDSYIIFHPSQVKSAIANRGTFDRARAKFTEAD